MNYRISFREQCLLTIVLCLSLLFCLMQYWLPLYLQWKSMTIEKPIELSEEKALLEEIQILEEQLDQWLVLPSKSLNMEEVQRSLSRSMQQFGGLFTVLESKQSAEEVQRTLLLHFTWQGSFLEFLNWLNEIQKMPWFMEEERMHISMSHDENQPCITWNYEVRFTSCQKVIAKSSIALPPSEMRNPFVAP